MSERYDLVAYTVCLLRRPPDAPDLPEEELDRLQDAHLTYKDDLRAQGKLLANGPFDDQPDESLRGFSVYAVDVEEAKELAAADPSVQAGRLVAETFTWFVPRGLVRFGAGD